MAARRRADLERRSLIADETVDYGHGEAQREALHHGARRRAGGRRRARDPGYEDVWYYLWKERRLPANVDPLKSKLKDEEERARLARIFEQGWARRRLRAAAATIRRADRPRWESGPWFLRAEHLFLIPGDSPMGFRLPLDSLPWVDAGRLPHLYEADPFARDAALPPQQQSVSRRSRSASGPRGAGRGAGAADAWRIRRGRRSHGALRRAAARAAARVHAAGRVDGGLPRPGRGDRRHGGER